MKTPLAGKRRRQRNSDLLITWQPAVRFGCHTAMESRNTLQSLSVTNQRNGPDFVYFATSLAAERSEYRFNRDWPW